mgnify:CR=1 FL=1
MEYLERALDMGIALELAKHMENPCSVKVNGREENLRDFYIRESERVISTFQNQSARKFLEGKIKKYK